MAMSRGELVETGKTDDVLWSPQHEYTRRLLADVPRLHSNGTAPAESAGA